MPSSFGSGYSRGNLGKPWVLRRATTMLAQPPAPAPLKSDYCGPCCDTSQSLLHEAKAIVIECMDFRLRDNTSCHLNLLGYKNEYDECICAGCSLGYNGLLTYSGWAQFIDEHVNLAFDLHDITEIKIIDHMSCGAYKAQYGTMTEEQEYQHHVDNLKICADALWTKFNPIDGTIVKIHHLKIMTYILSIDASKMENVYNKSE
jgi:hypothetical protein